MDNIIFKEEFRLSGTNYHQKEATKIVDKLSKRQYYFGKTDTEISRYIHKNYKPIFKYNNLKTYNVILQREPSNKHDKNAIKVLVDGHFAGYIPADIASKINYYIKSSDFRYNACLTGRGGPYKTLDIDLNKVVSNSKEITFYLSLSIISNKSDSFSLNTKSGKKKYTSKDYTQAAIVMIILGLLLLFLLPPVGLFLIILGVITLGISKIFSKK